MNTFYLYVVVILFGIVGGYLAIKLFNKLFPNDLTRKQLFWTLITQTAILIALSYALYTLRAINMLAAALMALMIPIAFVGAFITSRFRPHQEPQESAPPPTQSEPQSIELLPPDRPHEEVIQELLKKNREG